MDNPTLLDRLVEQSARGKEPFNSLAYRELSERNDVDGAALASTVIRLRNADALLPLLLLRKRKPDAYRALPTELRAEVLTEALGRSQTFNTWGLPDAYLEDASLAMLECDGSALPALRKLLSQTRAAPVFGSQEHLDSLRYRYRLCDYALFFLERLEVDPKFVMPVAISTRDELILRYRSTHGG